MDAYYLWDDNRAATAPIRMAESVSKGSESQYLVKVQRNGLEAALRELTEKAKLYGKKRRLEVHCHGHPAALHIGSDYGVSHRDVHIFGAWLKNALQPGGLIELLACWVAAQSQSDDFAYELCKTPKRQITGYHEEYHGAIRREYLAKYKKGNNPSAGSGRSLVFKPREPHKPRGLVFKPLFSDPFVEDPKSFFTPKPENDGVKFCLTLARTSQCRVRAGITIQYEDLEDIGALNNPIGNWENEVFDFFPSGQIKFVGKSPYRGPRMNSYDMTRLTA